MSIAFDPSPSLSRPTTDSSHAKSNPSSITNYIFRSLHSPVCWFILTEGLCKWRWLKQRHRCPVMSVAEDTTSSLSLLIEKET
ncbi:unnamed protein product [Lactuca virosa]|uniref:Uncharacterized protein n=1 Tax=Lactuca virosa TaxID=75947 RepID=A0AAU9MG24_9ASTR|nr:unnamed protein product [Lactuca virosa]